ncbi:hypothetical protein [Methylomagnum ishizawai]|nr:hypothetical protein [Methylomagnum ishizawai]
MADMIGEPAALRAKEPRARRRGPIRQARSWSVEPFMPPFPSLAP